MSTTAAKAPAVSTVRGDTPVESLGATLMHEHIIAVSAALANDRPELVFPDGKQAAIDGIVGELESLNAAGIDTVVDLTIFGHDRDIPALIQIADRAPVNIIVATGFFTHDEPSKTFLTRQATRQSIGKPNFYADVFLRDIRDGIAGTSVRAGIIKCVTDTPGMTGPIADMLVGAALAAAETGVPITTHTHAPSENGLDQLDVFRSHGIDLERVVIGHSGDTEDLDYLKKIMDTGATIGSDRFGLYRPGTPGLDGRVQAIADLCAQGYGDRIVISHDVMLYTDWFEPGTMSKQYPDWHLTHISTTVIPALYEAGVTETDLTRILVGNPARILARQKAIAHV